MNNIIMNVVSIIFIIGLLYYTYSIYKKRTVEKKRISKTDKDKLLYLFVDSNINLIEINKNIPLPLSKNEYLQFKKIPKHSRGYIFDYTNILEINMQYIENNLIKKNVTTDKLDMILNVRPKKVYYLYADNDGNEEVSIKFVDITKESL